MQAEIWRAASHSRFHARYFRVIPGFLGLKSFLNFFKNRVLGPIFTLQSTPAGISRGLGEQLYPLPCTLCVPNFFEGFFFLHRFPAAREPDGWTVTQAVTSGKIARLPPRPAPQNQDLPKLLETTKKPRGEPRGFSGAVDET